MASHASSSKSALSPARARISSTSQRCRPTPGTGSGADGSTETRQRVIAAVGWPKSAASVCRRQRRSAMPIGPGTFRRELQPPRGGHRQARDLGDDGAEPAMPQPFLHAGEHGLVVAGLDIDHPVGSEAGLGERRREQVRARDAPEHLALGAGRDAGGEQRRRRAIDRAVATAGDLVQRAERQPAAGKAHRCAGPRTEAPNWSGARGPRCWRSAPGAHRWRAEVACLVALPSRLFPFCSRPGTRSG